MKEFIIGKNDAGQRLDRFIGKVVPLLPGSLAQKYIRLKRFKIGGKRANRDYVLVQGDVVQMYINDEYFDEVVDEVVNDKNAHLHIKEPKLDVLYEDENILLLNKAVGILCHSDRRIDLDSLIQHTKAYLYQKGEWYPEDENSFSPALCNRIDRNTSGIVIVAKNAQALRILNEKIRLREIDKYYVAIVMGKPEPPAGRLEGYLEKDAASNMVHIQNQSKLQNPISATAKAAILEYRTLAEGEEHSLLECLLITGRTHQIRAQLADMGTAILGDSKYGNKSMNKQYGEKHQALCSFKLVFSFKSDAGILQYLDKKEFVCEKVPFVDKYYPEYSLLD